MRKLFAAAVIACGLALAGCSATGGNPISQIVSTVQAATAVARLNVQNPVTLARVYQLRATYAAVVLAPAANYARLPLCRRSQPDVKVCARRNVVLALQRADRTAEQALDKLEAFVRSNPRLNASALWNAAQAAIAQFKEVKATYGIR